MRSGDFLLIQSPKRRLDIRLACADLKDVRDTRALGAVCGRKRFHQEILDDGTVGSRLRIVLMGMVLYYTSIHDVRQPYQEVQQDRAPRFSMLRR